MTDQVKVTFEKDGISISSNRVSKEEFIKAVVEFAKKHKMTITEIENGAK